MLVAHLSGPHGQGMDSLATLHHRLSLAQPFTPEKAVSFLPPGQTKAACVYASSGPQHKKVKLERGHEMVWMVVPFVLALHGNRPGGMFFVGSVDRRSTWMESLGSNLQPDVVDNSYLTTNWPLVMVTVVVPTLTLVLP
jgi:hypothetical protein